MKFIGMKILGKLSIKKKNIPSFIYKKINAKDAKDAREVEINLPVNKKWVSLASLFMWVS
jgi:hypothetical protein